jgi:hypothetical protein
MIKVTRLFIVIFMLSMVFGCSSTKHVSTLYSDSYDKAKDQTSIVIFPYGQVSIPGKWTNTRYSNVSAQYFFKNADSMTFAVAMNPLDSYEFYKKEMTKAEFLKAYYEWDSEYLKKVYNGELKKIKEDTAKNFIIWSHVSADKNNYFLFGVKNTTAFNLLIETDKWDEAKKVELLENVYFSQ